MLRIVSWRLGALLAVAVALGCGHSGQFTWSPSPGTPDLTTIDRAKWDNYVGRIVQVSGEIEYRKLGPFVGGVYVDDPETYAKAQNPVVVTGVLVRHDDRILARNGAQAINGIYYSLKNVKSSVDN